MCKICWSLVIVFGVATFGMAYKFIIQGSVEQGTDGRLAVQLNAGERDFVLTEMRTFLESVQQITQGITENNMEMISKAARMVGNAAQQQAPGPLIAKLPLEFKKLGFDTHSKFTQLALDAEQLGDKQHTLNQLSELMQNCVACHATYKIEIAATK